MIAGIAVDDIIAAWDDAARIVGEKPKGDNK